MKLLLDEMLSPDIATELQARGHDVQAVADSPHSQLSDAEVLDLANSQQRAVVTNNLRDFRPLHHAAISPGATGHYGMVFMPGSYRRTKDDIGRIEDALEEKLNDYPGVEDLVNAETWLAG